MTNEMNDELAAFALATLGRTKDAPVDLDALIEGGSRGSILNGGAGIAFFLSEAARLRGDEAALSAARRWLDASFAWAKDAKPADWLGSPVGFLMGEGGLRFVDAIVSAQEGNQARAGEAAAWIARAASGPGDVPTIPGFEAELLGGAAGIAVMSRVLEARLASAEHGARAMLAKVREEAIARVLRKHSVPLEPQPRELVGSAHGYAGELWALVALCGPAQPVVRARLEEAWALREIDEEGLVYWLPSRESDAMHLLPTWCNGMAGHALLWCEVARQDRSAETLERARLCAETVDVLAAVGGSICCGVAGQALALARWADVSGDDAIRARADEKLAQAASLDLHPLAFWQGAQGVALAALTKLAGERAWPCIEAPPQVSSDGCP